MEITWYEFVWSVINFVVILAILYKLFYKPVMKFLDERRETIANNLSEAENARQEAEKLLSDYKEKLDGARKEAQEILARAAKAGEETRAAIIEESRKEAAAILAKAQEEIRREKEDALKSLRQEVAGLAVLVAEKVVSKSFTREDHVRMVEQFINEVGELN